MIKQLINNDWKYSHLYENIFLSINLPFDNMFVEGTDSSSLGSKNISYFVGKDYEFVKKIKINGNKDDTFYLEFEGVYKDAEIYINDVLVHKENYGYNTFYVDITSAVILNSTNCIKVITHNSDQPNSRWYSGSGIYRNVSLITLPKEHIKLNGIKVVADHNGFMSINLCSNFNGPTKFEIFDNNKLMFIKEIETDKQFKLKEKINDVIPWSEQNPKLYRLVVSKGIDTRDIMFGFRSIVINSDGLFINNIKTILYGACIHHDNGLLGAIEDKNTAYRKIKILKEAGYNAIRSAHNPISKDLLDACDHLGIYVLDEYVDCWFTHKTMYDYASYVESNYDHDIKLLVDKDFNHPSVIMYSSGNEVGESSTKKGIAFTKTLTDTFHKYDSTRSVTCGINIFFNYLYKLGFGVYSDKKAIKEAISKPKKKKKSVGSEFFNDLAGKLGAGFMKRCATLHGCDVNTKYVFNNVDVAGYNYGIYRYKHDIKKYPNRIILGTETFCSDASLFYELSTKYPRIIGDFVWAGFDYLGEVGVGSWTSEEYCNGDFLHELGWLTAGSGRIDITGRKNSEVDYTLVSFNKKDIAIGVEPIQHYKSKCSPSSWKFSKCYPVFNFPGFEGKHTNVEVYTKAYKTAIYINEKHIKTIKPNKNNVARFKIKYETGILKAVGLDKNNKQLYETTLKGSNDIPHIVIEQEKQIFDSPYIYLDIKAINDCGVVTSYDSELEVVEIKGAKLISFGNGCSYNKFGYLSNKSFLFYGQALAIVKKTDKDSYISIKSSNSITSIKF